MRKNKDRKLIGEKEQTKPEPPHSFWKCTIVEILEDMLEQYHAGS